MNTQDKTFYINYNDSFNEQKVNDIMHYCSDTINKHNPDILYFCISSKGGMVVSGITLYNFLMALPVKIIMHNIGSVSSVSTIVFLAGEERYASPNSTFLFHGAYFTSSKPLSLSLYQFREKLSSLEEDHNRMAGIITERARLTEKEVRKLFREGAVKDPVFAKDKGIIHNIQSLSIPPNSPIVSFNFRS